MARFNWKLPEDMDWNHPLANRYWGMIRRCYDPWHKSFKDYGAMNVFVCDRWIKSFEAYCDDILLMLKEIGYRNFDDLKKHKLVVDKDKFAASNGGQSFYHPDFCCLLTKKFNNHYNRGKISSARQEDKRVSEVVDMEEHGRQEGTTQCQDRETCVGKGCEQACDVRGCEAVSGSERSRIRGFGAGIPRG